MAFKVFFRKAIEKYFPDDPSETLHEVERRYQVIAQDTRFAATSPNPIDKRLDFCAYFLALIQVLENKNLSYEEIKKICLEITYAYVSPKNPFQRWLKKLPVKLIGLRVVKPLLKLFHEKINTRGNAEGFRAEIITDKEETYGLGYGINILECGICKLFHKHNAGKYSTILCEVDKLTSSLAGLELIRKSTIAYGAETCDFRFKKISNKKGRDAQV